MKRFGAFFVMVLGILLALVGVLVGIGGAINGELALAPVGLIFCSVGAGVIYWGWRILRRPTTDGTAAPSRGERIGAYLADEPEVREHDGLACEVLYNQPTSGKHARPSLLTVSVQASPLVSFSLSRETKFDRWAKSVLLAHEL